MFGVYLPTIQHILGVTMFIRLFWVNIVKKFLQPKKVRLIEKLSAIVDYCMHAACSMH